MQSTIKNRYLLELVRAVGVVAVLWIASPSCVRQAVDRETGPDNRIRVMSWNVSGTNFIEQKADSRKLLRLARPDIILLDEVSPSVERADVVDLLRGISVHGDTVWHVSMGSSGGRQRGIVASRSAVKELSQFRTVPYPPGTREQLAMGDLDGSDPRGYELAGGIPVHGATVQVRGRRLLVVVVDLQCCSADEWQETKRRLEAREIRRRVRDAIREDPRLDGVIVAGDLNLVGTPLPLIILSGPYPGPVHGLLPAEVYHPDGETAWTWKDDETPFPPGILDLQLYSATHLLMTGGTIVDSETGPPKPGIDRGTSERVSDHRPVVVEYEFRSLEHIQ